MRTARFGASHFYAGFDWASARGAPGLPVTVFIDNKENVIIYTNDMQSTIHRSQDIEVQKQFECDIITEKNSIIGYNIITA